MKLNGRGVRHFGKLGRAEVIDLLAAGFRAYEIAILAGLRYSSWRNLKRLGLRRFIVGDVIIIESKGTTWKH